MAKDYRGVLAVLCALGLLAFGTVSCGDDGGVSSECQDYCQKAFSGSVSQSQISCGESVMIGLGNSPDNCEGPPQSPSQCEACVGAMGASGGDCKTAYNQCFGGEGGE